MQIFAERRQGLEANAQASTNQATRFLLYSHDGLGLGHMRRNLAIAEALTKMAPGSAILLCTGASHTAQFSLPENVDYLKLPEIRKACNDRYTSRRLSMNCADISHLRAQVLAAAVESFKPDVLLADKHPLGVNGELQPALKALRAHGGRASLGLRDILDDRIAVRNEWFEMNYYEQVLENYEQVLIYGQQSVYDPIKEYLFPPKLAERLKFCGYVVNRSEQSFATDSGLARLLKGKRKRPLVLATAGGGEDGFTALDAFGRACANAPWQGVIVAGPMMSGSEQEVLHRVCAENGVFFEPFIGRLEAFIGAFDTLVCMGGYNTLLEAMAVGIPTLCIPRSAPRMEQTIRARAFKDLGLLEFISSEDLNAERLRDGISAQLKVARPALNARVREILRFEGADRAASALLASATISGRKAEAKKLDPSMVWDENAA